MAPTAIANEFDILGEEVPDKEYVIDDGGVLSKAGRKTLKNELKTLDIKTGYRVTAITTRKLEFETDTFAFADKVAPATKSHHHVHIKAPYFHNIDEIIMTCCRCLRAGTRRLRSVTRRELFSSSLPPRTVP